MPCFALSAVVAAGAALADARLDQARKEGEILWYTAMNVPDTDALRKPFPQLDLRLLPRCAHLVHWDAADAFAELAGEFLAER